MARLARSLGVFRDEVNAKYPNRDKTSDGWMGDAAHSSRVSDHNPNSVGVVCAFDIDEDLLGKRGSYPHFQPGKNAQVLLDAILREARKGNLPWLRYVIYEGKIYSATRRGVDGKFWGPNDYNGPNAHGHHMHLSVFQEARLYDSTKPWNLFTTQPPKEEEDDMPDAKEIADAVWDKDINPVAGPGAEHDPAWYLRAIHDQVKGINVRLDALEKKIAP